jgi:hypothetical protein
MRGERRKGLRGLRRKLTTLKGAGGSLGLTRGPAGAVLTLHVVALDRYARTWMLEKPIGHGSEVRPRNRVMRPEGIIGS